MVYISHSDEKLTSSSLNAADKLQLPEGQQRSKSAEELPSPRLEGDNSISITTTKRSAPPRLMPQHSRSRSAQDSTLTSGSQGLLDQEVVVKILNR